MENTLFVLNNLKWLFVVGIISSPGSCVHTNDSLEVQYNGFSSSLGIFMYYVAISNTTEANNTECKEYVSQHFWKWQMNLIKL